MTEKNYAEGMITFICDGCGEEYLADLEERWEEIMEQMKKQGWRKRKNTDGNWEHYCSECEVPK